MTQLNVPDVGLSPDPRWPDQSAEIITTVADLAQNTKLSSTARGLYGYVASFGGTGASVIEILSNGSLQPREEVLAALEELLDADLIDLGSRP